MTRPTAPAMAILLPLLAVAIAGLAQEAGQEPEPVLGRSSASSFGARAAAETVELEHGSRLRLAPDLQSPLLEIVAEGGLVPVLDRHEGWVRVRFGTWKGWVLEEGRDTGLLVSAAPRDRQASVVALGRVLEIMGGNGRETTLGPYVLLTDLQDDGMVRRLDFLVTSLVESYRERFGIDPGPPRGEVIVIFKRESDYRELEREDLRLAGLETQGYTGLALIGGDGPGEESLIRTLTATFLGRREPDQLREVLVHELTHVLNLRAVGAYLPPWLEEGLAEDLALSQVDSTGRLVLGSWGGSSDVRYHYFGRGGDIDTRLTGSRAALEAVLSAWRTPYRPELELLSRLSWEMLVMPASRSLLYAQSAFLTRYLLDGAGEDSALRFRGYLADVAAGEAASDALWRRLNASPNDLEEDFYLWLRRQAAAYGVRVGGGLGRAASGGRPAITSLP